MATAHERFWEHDSFIVAGDSANRSFPLLTYRGLKRMGKTVVALDLGGELIDGDETIRRIEDLQTPIEAAVLELPKEKTADAVGKMAEAGIREIWIHQGTDTPEALNVASDAGITVTLGTCAVMYVDCTSYHKIHRWLWRLFGKY